MAKVVVYSSGICMASVCAEKGMTPQQVEDEVNIVNPTGISSRWRISDDAFREGADNPHPCDKEPDRLHYLLSC